MGFKFSRTPLLALVVGIYLELSIRNGICDDSKLHSSSYQGNKSSTHRHTNRSWKGWEDWLPSTIAENQQYQQRHSHDIPYSLSEQAKMRYRGNRTEKKLASQQQQTVSKSSKNTTEKTRSEGDSIIDLKNLRDTAKSLARTVTHHFMTSWSSLSSNTQKPTVSDSNVLRNNRAVQMDKFGKRQEFGKPERDTNRGVIDWLSRLIGVQGKTLGEFLREYQVHVLYDLAFTFFKWIFFLYAGLLIP